MKIPKYARYDYSVKHSCEFLEDFNISRFPINPFEIVESQKWGLITYSEMAKKKNCTIKDVIISLGSYDGFTIYDDENYTVAYNDTQPKKRILFTLLHEIGHIRLNHLVDFEHTILYRGSLTKSENKVLENEANAFARNTLAPSVFVKLLPDKSKKSLSRYFGISYKAAQTRLEFLEQDWQSVVNTRTQSRLRLLFYRFYYRHGCTNCNAIIYIKNAIHCPICGMKKIKWGEGQMIYKKYDTHTKTNKVKTCPNCDNEETDIDGDYCQICGKPLVNRCDNREINGGYNEPCGELVPSNARYCPYCGYETVFLNDGVLKEWHLEAEEEGSSVFELETENFMNIPDSNEEPPFN